MSDLRFGFWVTIGMILLGVVLDIEEMSDFGLIGNFIFMAAIGVVKGLREPDHQ